MGSPRKGDPPWNDRWPCPEDAWNHAVLKDKDGNASFHYLVPGMLGKCPGTGQPIKE